MLNPSSLSAPLPLMRTKLAVPQPHAGWVARPRLLELVSQGCRRPLTLICAPAGYGKTTLLADWIHTAQHSADPPGVCWISLDETDNDALRFLEYLNAAVGPYLTKAQAEMCGNILGALRAAPSIIPQQYLVALLNALEQHAGEVIVVLDDYHTIQDPAVHKTVQFLLDHLPASAHLAITTRSDPPLGLARLRARDQMCEIRMDGLAFTSSEASEFLNQRHGLDLSDGEMSALEERTEGWAAGLQLAALAMKSPALPGPAGRSTFIQNVLSSHRHILEYLTEEVFNQQPEAVKTFLLCTSVLDRLCAPLCDALLHREAGRLTGKEAWIGFTIPPALTSQHLLDMLEGSQLFIIPLDAERRWFRYHSLFSGLLRGRLQQEHPGLAEILLARAALWSENQGYLADAFRQALAANNTALAADLFERHILTFFFQSEFTQVKRWLDALPVTTLLQRSLLCAVYGAAEALLAPFPPRSLPGAEKWLAAADSALADAQPGSDVAQAFLLMIRSYWARFRQEPGEQVIRLIEQAMTALPDETGPSADRRTLFIRSGLQTNLALVLWEMGDEQASHSALVEAQRISRACGDLLNEAAVTNYLVRIDHLYGRLEEAAALCREALAHFTEQQSLGRRAPFSAEIGIRLGEILIDQNRLEEARQHLLENIELARWTMSHNILLHGYLALARIELAGGNFPAALRYLDAAAPLSAEGTGLAEAQRAHAWLAAGRENPRYLAMAKEWAAAQQEWSPERVSFAQGPPRIGWRTALAVAQVDIATGDPVRVQERAAWLEGQADVLEGRGWAQWEIKLRLAACLAWQRLGEPSKALAALRRALQAAEPGGFARIFLDEGEALQGLLARLDEQPAQAREWTQPAAGPPPPPSPTPAQRLVEPLTARELEVLRLICLGLSNQEIADQLVVTLNTVKKHIYSIFQKLGVQSRSQAIRQARLLGLESA